MERFTIYKSAFDDINDTVSIDDLANVVMLRKYLTDVTKFVNADKWPMSVKRLREFLPTADAEKIKRSLPGVVFYARIDGPRGHGSHDIDKVESSGLVCLDLDYKDNEYMFLKYGDSAVRDMILERFNSVVLMFMSPRGKGLKVIHRIDTFGFDADVDDIRNECKSVNSYFWEQYKSISLRVDPLSDYNRLCFLSYERSAYYNLAAEHEQIFVNPRKYFEDKIPVSIKPTDVEKIRQMTQKIVECRKDIAPDYNSYLQLGFSLAQLGEAGREIFHTVCTMSKKYDRADVDRKFSNCLSSKSGDGVTIATFFYLCKKANIK